jgi:hypothetical protein
MKGNEVFILPRKCLKYTHYVIRVPIFRTSHKQQLMTLLRKQKNTAFLCLPSLDSLDMPDEIIFHTLHPIQILLW